MDIKKILSIVDHTLLVPTVTWAEIQGICDDAIKFNVAAVCIPASYVKRAKNYVDGKMAICTVIGFPNGYSTTATKYFETKDALNNGADEIDMVINLGNLRDKNYSALLEEISDIKKICGDKILKVIIETCLLSDEEKIKMCEIVNKSGADFIKTSTGCSIAGATAHDIQLFASHIDKNIGIKAAGGIASLADAQNFIELGATRLGTSRIIKIAKNESASGY